MTTEASNLVNLTNYSEYLGDKSYQNNSYTHQSLIKSKNKNQTIYPHLEIVNSQQIEAHLLSRKKSEKKRNKDLIYRALVRLKTLHNNLDTVITKLSRKTYLTSEEEQSLKQLKFKKLIVKEKILSYS
jgi:hypothetical protein